MNPVLKKLGWLTAILTALLIPRLAAAGEGHNGYSIGGVVPIEFVVFAASLLGVAKFHHYKLYFAAGGAAVVSLYKFGNGTDLSAHLGHEWALLANLFCLLTGFALLAKHFEDSKLGDWLPKILPDGWTGGLVLLVMIFFMSAVLDNIAAALIGATIAGEVFKKKVHVGYLAAIVAASNAGGSGSVVGDTTTTMMWLAGKSPLSVLHAYIPAVVALGVCGVIASRQQDAHQRIQADPTVGLKIDFGRLAVVGFVLVSAVCANIAVNLNSPELADQFPVIGATVWCALILSTPVRRPHWGEVGPAANGAVFLLSLVWLASLMPVEALPGASALTTFMLGGISAVFDNIPLTKLALDQGGYDWGMLAFSVGYGGSMIWFGSSAGVAVCSRYEEAGQVGNWLRKGWHVALGYVVAYAVAMVLWGWHPEP